MEQQEDVIIIADDYRPQSLINQVQKHGYGVVYCAKKEECEKALHTYGNRIHTLIIDNTFIKDPELKLKEYDVKKYGFEIVRSLRNGEYGDAIKRTPVAIVSGGSVDPEVKYFDPPVSVYGKSEESMHNGVIKFIKTGVPEESYTVQEMRNHNAHLLIGMLNKDAVVNVETVNVSRFPSERHDFAKERIAEMRKAIKWAFFYGKPDKEYLDQLKEVLTGNREFYFDDDKLNNQHALIIGQLKTSVNTALKAPVVGR